MHPKPFNPGRRGYSSMTIGIGLVTSTGIILASDSRTETDEGLKQLNRSKMTFFDCTNFKAGIVQAGKTNYSSEAIRLLKKEVALAEPRDCDAFLSMIKRVCLSISAHANTLFPDQLRAKVESEFQFIIAIVAGTERRLFTLNSKSSLPLETVSGVEFIGSGERIADYILRGVPGVALQDYEGLALAAYAVNETCKKDGDCEPPVRLAIVGHEGAKPLPESEIVDLVNAGEEVEKEVLRTWAKSFSLKIAVRSVI